MVGSGELERGRTNEFRIVAQDFGDMCPAVEGVECSERGGIRSGEVLSPAHDTNGWASTPATESDNRDDLDLEADPAAQGTLVDVSRRTAGGVRESCEPAVLECCPVLGGGEQHLSRGR